MRKLICLFIFLLVPLPGYADVKIIELKNRAASDIVAQVQEVLDDSEKIQAAGHHLVLIADGESLLAAEKLIELLDQRQRNLIVRIRQVQEKTAAGKEVSNTVRYNTETGFSRDTELTVRRGNAVSYKEQNLTLLEGSRGFIEVGKEIPYTQQWATFSGRMDGYSEGIAYKTITTGFWIVPVRVLEKEVLVDIEPYFAEAGSIKYSNAPSIKFGQLKSRLNVPLAQWYPLGQQMMHRDKVSRAIISWRTADRQTDQQLEIRIDPAE